MTAQSPLLYRSKHSRLRYALDTASCTLLHSYSFRFQPFHDKRLHRRIHLRRCKSPTVFARWRMASMSSRNILTIAETTRRTALIRHKTVGRHHAASVEIRPTPKTAGTKPTKQRTIWRCYGRSESLHKSLRRKFDPTSNYLEAKVQY